MFGGGSRFGVEQTHDRQLATRVGGHEVGMMDPGIESSVVSNESEVGGSLRERHREGRALSTCGPVPLWTATCQPDNLSTSPVDL